MKYFNVGIMFTLAALSSIFLNETRADVGKSAYQSNGSPKNIYKSGDVGLGLMFGSTTGVTAKFWTTEARAFDLGVSFRDSNTAIMADYLWHWRDAFAPTGNDYAARSFVPYFGMGLVAGWGGNTTYFSFNNTTQNFALGAKIPIGLEFIPSGVPLGLFAELDPGVGFVPNTFSFFEGNMGARYYF